MKKINVSFFLIIVIISFSGCKNNSNNEYTQSSPELSSKEDNDTLQKFYGKWRSNNIKEISLILSESIDINSIMLEEKNLFSEQKKTFLLNINKIDTTNGGRILLTKLEEKNIEISFGLKSHNEMIVYIDSSLNRSGKSVDSSERELDVNTEIRGVSPPFIFHKIN